MALIARTLDGTKLDVDFADVNTALQAQALVAKTLNVTRECITLLVGEKVLSEDEKLDGLAHGSEITVGVSTPLWSLSSWARDCYPKAKYVHEDRACKIEKDVLKIVITDFVDYNYGAMGTGGGSGGDDGEIVAIHYLDGSKVTGETFTKTDPLTDEARQLVRKWGFVRNSYEYKEDYSSDYTTVEWVPPEVQSHPSWKEHSENVSRQASQAKT